MPKGGLILKRPKLKDFAFEQIYGSAPKNELIVPLNRDISGIPDVYQGQKNDCVACSFTWIKQYMEKKHPDLSHEFLAQVGKTKPQGATPGQIAEAARKIGISTQLTWDNRENILNEDLLEEAKKHKLGSYSYVQDLSMHGIYAALKKGPLAIGVRNFNGIGAHMMAAHNVTPDGLALLCKDSNDPNTPAIVPFKDVVVAVACHDEVDKTIARLPFFQALWLKVTWKKWQAILGAILTLVSGAGAYGAYTPVTSYEARTTSYIDAAATTIPVSTVVDRAGNAIDLSNMPSGRVYFNLEPGLPSKEELIYCTGISGSSWTGCVRGLSFQGGSLSSSSTLTKAHNAGSKIIMTNIGQFFTEFVSTTGTNRIGGQTTFDLPPKIRATTTLPTSDDQLTSWYAAQTLVAGGFSSLNASDTLGLVTFTGLINCETSGTCVGINASGTASLNGGFLKFTPVTGTIYWDIISFLAGNWTIAGNWIFSGTVTIQNVLGDILKIPSATTSTVTGLVATNYDALTQLMATGTAGMPIVTGNALYVSTTGTLFLADSSQTTTTYSFVGIAQSGANVGQTVLYVRPGGIARGLSSLSPGKAMYLSTAGGVSTLPGTVPALIGTALTASTLQLAKPDFYAVKSGSLNFNGTSPVDLGWIPSKVTFFVNSTGFSTSTYTLFPDGTSSTNKGCTNQQFTTSTKGFTLVSSCTGIGGYIAEYDLGGLLLTPGN